VINTRNPLISCEPATSGQNFGISAHLQLPNCISLNNEWNMDQTMNHPMAILLQVDFFMHHGRLKFVAF
jgi:hypothetical protein